MVTLPGSGAFLDVDRIVGSLAISHGAHAADLGCGSGYFTIALARAVGDQGVVIAVDIMQEPLESVQARVEGMGLGNVRVVRANLEVVGSTRIPENSQDIALMKNVLFQSQQQDKIIQEAARITKPNGRIVMIDWKKGTGGFGPPDEMRPDTARLRAFAIAAGLQADHELSVDQYHFGLVFRK